SRSYYFRHAVKVCKKVRLDEARGDLEIALHPFAIQQYGNPVRRIPNVNQASSFASIMANDAAPLREFAGEHALDFFRAVTPVSSGSDQNRRILKPHTRHFGKQRFEHDLSRLSTRDVTDRNRDPLAGPDQFSQWQPADRF